MWARLLLIFWRVGRSDLRRWWRAARSPARPRWLIPATAALGVFALFPGAWVIPIVGALDALVIAPLLFHWMVGQLPDEPPGVKRP